MKWLAAFLGAMLLLPAVVCAQGLRMSPDFLPLAVGNKWTYTIVNEDGKKIGDTQFEVADHKIVDGKSFYIVSGFPFVEDGGQIHLVRYDRQDHQFMRQLDDQDGPLFLGDGAEVEVTDKDPSGLPLKFVLRSPTVALTFQRGVGIIEARLQTGNGIQIAKIDAARVGQGVAAGGTGTPITTSTNASDASQVPPPPKTAAEKTKDLSDSVGTITTANPQLIVVVDQVGTSYKFTLTVTNTSDKLLPFSFMTSEKFDFAVVDPANNHEVWRMSRQTLPSAVKMTEAILPHEAWTFDVTWNHRDNDDNPVAAGTYQIVGFVATHPVLESEPVNFVIK
jgi:hypothetical protein